MTDIDIVQLVKDRNPIDLVIADDFPTEGHGRYRTARQHNSLVIDTHNQAYHWNSRDEHGDVINWVMSRRGCDFKQAVEELCKRAGLPDPVWNEGNHQARVIARAREDLNEVATTVFQRWLRSTPDAMEYARSRGWTDETIATARLGYSGPGGARTDLRDELMGELIKAGADVDSPAAVALLGWHGDVKAWGTEHQVEVHADWIKQGFIPSLIGMNMLVYPYVWAGKVIYFHGRAIADQPLKHYNSASCLVGARPLYFNQAWSSKAKECVIVEGEGDAVTLTQWGIPAVALAMNTFTENNKADLVSQLKDQHAYNALDADKAGKAGSEVIAQLMGPLTRMMSWGEDKDANEMLKMMRITQVEHDAQVERVKDLMRKAKTWVEVIAEQAGDLEGAEQKEAQIEVFKVIQRLGDVDRAQYRSKLARAMGLGTRDYDHILRKMETSAEASNPEDEPVYTFGGFFDGYLVEYLYDPINERSSLAWRDPQGKIETGDSVMINGRRYTAEPPNATVKRKALPFPTKIGESKSLRELLTYIEIYIKKTMILPSDRMGRLIAYWVLSSWVYDMFSTTMYLRFVGSPGSGKSEMATRIGMLSYRTLAANGAGSMSSLFRAVQRYRCSVFIDEADISGSDTENDMVKFYNLGAMRQNSIIWRTEKVIINGRETFEEAGFDCFCPKIVAMRKDFKDTAVGSRSITLKLQPREVTELIAANISLTVTEEMEKSAEAMQNLLLRWRLTVWEPSKEVNPEYYDQTISARLNQVAGPILSISENDPEQQEEIRRELREYYSESILNLSMGLAARVLESMWKIWKFPDLHLQMVHDEPDGTHAIKIGDITKIANELMDEMNGVAGEGDEDEGEDEGKRKFKRKEEALKPHRVGNMLRQELQLQVSKRRRDGFYVYWNEPRMIGLANRYGIVLDEIGPEVIDPEKTLAGRVEKVLEDEAPDVL